MQTREEEERSERKGVRQGEGGLEESSWEELEEECRRAELMTKVFHPREGASSSSSSFFFLLLLLTYRIYYDSEV